MRDDAEDAVAWLTERADELGFDPDAIVSTGASAGAVNSIHMIVMAPDQADVTINVAHRLFTECLAGMAAKRRDAAGTPKGRPAR